MVARQMAERVGGMGTGSALSQPLHQIFFEKAEVPPAGSETGDATSATRDKVDLNALAGVDSAH